MRNALLIIVLALNASATVSNSPSPVLRGTINVVIANENGIVVVTDSMLTKKWQDRTGAIHSEQVKEPAQKLFRIDDQTVCAFAGFASTDTSALPDFLNNVSAIMGRFEQRLKDARGNLSFEDKLELLNGTFSYYLTGIAEIRDKAGNYDLALLLAGFDKDGTAKIGQLLLNVPPTRTDGEMFRTDTKIKKVVPIKGEGTLWVNGTRMDVPQTADTAPWIFVNGKPALAVQILRDPMPWKSADPAIAAYADAVAQGRTLNLDQMVELAVSLKQHTADHDDEVGGPTQIATLVDGRIQKLDSTFAPLILRRFNFSIVSTIHFANYKPEPDMAPPGFVWGRPQGNSSFCGMFCLYFANTWLHCRQVLDNAYWARNEFQDSVLAYEGGRLMFETSNKVIDSDLEIGVDVPKNSPEAKALLANFKWRSVEDKRIVPAKTAH